jgi:hypothetical protein
MADCTHSPVDSDKRLFMEGRVKVEERVQEIGAFIKLKASEAQSLFDEEIKRGSLDGAEIAFRALQSTYCHGNRFLLLLLFYFFCSILIYHIVRFLENIKQLAQEKLSALQAQIDNMKLAAASSVPVPLAINKTETDAPALLRANLVGSSLIAATDVLPPIPFFASHVPGVGLIREPKADLVAVVQESHCGISIELLGKHYIDCIEALLDPDCLPVLHTLQPNQYAVMRLIRTGQEALSRRS